MCPGGLVVAASSEEGVGTNGMSYHARSSGFANSALVVTVGRRDFASSHCLAGVAFQREWERKAFIAGGGNYHVPAQSVKDYVQGNLTGQFNLSPTYRPGYRSVDLRAVLPQEIGDALARAILFFDGKLKGFAGGEATLCGVESRTSVGQILRDDRGRP
jgi:uncharacterized FAD-dependent dehydrogenase